MDDATKLTPLSDALAGDLSPDQLAALEDALPTLLPLLDDADALKSRLKALGVAKLGHRLKVFGVLQRYEPPPPPSESSGFWERIAAGSTEATAVADSDELPIARALASPAPVPAPAAAVPTVPPTPPMPPPEPADDIDSSSSYPSAAPEDASEIYRQRGNAAYGRGDIPAARGWYERALVLRPESAVLLSNLAACLLAAEPPRPAEALTRLQAALRADSTHAKARLRAGRCCVMLGALDAAHEHYTVALQGERRAAGASSAPRWAPAADGAGGGAAPASGVAATAAEGRATASKLRSYCDRSAALSRAGRTDEALYLAWRVVRGCTHSALGPRLVVGALEAAGRAWEALAEAEEARVRFGSDADLAIAHARLLCARGRADEAAAPLECALAADADAAAVARALRGLRVAIRAKERGNAEYAAGNFHQAEAEYTAALEADGASMLTTALLGNRAQARVRRGAHAEALVDLDAALARDATALKLLLRRAACHRTLGHRALARADYEAVRRLDPASEAAAEGVAACGGGDDAGDAGGGDGGGGGGGGGGESPYDVLGVARDATTDEVRAAFKRAALRWHPDRHSGGDDEARELAELNFKRINRAHAILADAGRRRQFDLGARAQDLA